MTIGERLREERERLNLSQPKFAEVAGTTKQTLFSWESGKTAPDAIQLAALVAIGVDAPYVLTGKRQMAGAEQRASNAIDMARLTLAVEAVEAGLEDAGRVLPAHKKAELITAAYDLLDQTPHSQQNVTRLLRLAA